MDFDLLLRRTPGTMINQNLAATVEPRSPVFQPSEEAFLLCDRPSAPGSDGQAESVIALELLHHVGD
jgi:hypothetical protein